MRVRLARRRAIVAMLDAVDTRWPLFFVPKLSPLCAAGLRPQNLVRGCLKTHLDRSTIGGGGG